MAGSNSVNQTDITFRANGAITRYYCVIQDPTADGEALLPTADNMDCLGIAIDGCADNELFAVCMGGGTTQAVASGSISRGDLLMCASGGKVKTALTSGTINIIARALEDASDGEQLKVQVLHSKAPY